MPAEALSIFCIKLTEPLPGQTDGIKNVSWNMIRNQSNPDIKHLFNALKLISSVSG